MTQRKLDIIKNYSQCSYMLWKILTQGAFFKLYHDTCSILIFLRVHAHAAAALINFCEVVERDTLLPYLDPIVEHLLKLLNYPAGNPSMVRRHVQEQAITR